MKDNTTNEVSYFVIQRLTEQGSPVYLRRKVDESNGKRTLYYTDKIEKAMTMSLEQVFAFLNEAACAYFPEPLPEKTPYSIISIKKSASCFSVEYFSNTKLKGKE